MYQINETELTSRINTFMERKSRQLAERESQYGSQAATDSSRTTSRTPSLIEKMNEFWVSRVHA